jgi:Flp pilus assembly protein TadG
LGRFRSTKEKVKAHLPKSKWFSSLFRFRLHQAGNVTMMLAFGLPAMMAAVGVATDFSIMALKRTNLQSAADQAALAAAKELAVASSTDQSIVAAAISYATAALAKNDSDAKTLAVADHSAGSVTVSISEAWTPFMAQFIEAGVTPINVTATAKTAGSTNICVLALDQKDNKTLYMDTNARLSANGCGVYSDANHNHAIWLDQNAVIKADLTCAVGGIKSKTGGSIVPAGVTNCPPVADPLSARTVPTIPTACIATNLVINTGVVTLQPGKYCGGLEVGKTAQVTLLSGTYIITGGPLKVSDTATFRGSHVGFYLDGDKSLINFTDKSTIDLSGSIDPEMAGLLFFEDPAITSHNQHHIASASVLNLTGTIYLPHGTLLIDPNSPVAAQSAYTALIVNRLQLSAGPELVLNSDYGATDVPVPAGIKSSSSVVLAN